ncbi:hypothetical protein M378DRAFT_169250 [Amanita muscaria Koide BX008]|uniref:Uncharacterized protein n=1 Tax=Amanita muscaria (strain Koide BX008) TaxID=946122 RepID=A0A0C2WRS5_AMAMK|nr:hypothetical protein M378DRAFT_169250 [Amanita muscaria Koide BX008]
MDAQPPVQTLGAATPKNIQAKERSWALGGAKDQPPQAPPKENETKSIPSNTEDPEQDASAMIFGLPVKN